MMYCAECKTEYVEEMAFCPDCGAKLVTGEEWEEIRREEEAKRTRLKGLKMAPACDVEGRIEALQIVAVLEQEKIPVFVRTNEETAYDGLFVLQNGWGEIWVAEDRLQEARDLIEELKKNPPPPPPDSD